MFIQAPHVADVVERYHQPEQCTDNSEYDSQGISPEFEGYAGKDAKNFQVFSLWAMGALTAVTVWSGVDYVLGYLRVVHPAQKK